MTIFANNLMYHLVASTPDYTDYVDNQTYYSGKITFNPKGLNGLYKFTDSFMSSLLPINFLTKEQYDAAYNGSLDYKHLTIQHWSLIVALAFVILVSILLPIIGLIFACCRCCGNCGAKAEPNDKKKDFCKKAILAVLLTGCCAFLLFGVVGSFATNQQLQDGTMKFPHVARKVYKDSLSYLTSTRDQARVLFHENYIQFGDTFKATIDESGKNILEQIPLWANLSSMDNIVSFINETKYIKTDMILLRNMTNSLKSMSSQITDGLKTITKNLEITLNQCGNLSACQEISNELSNLKVNVDFNQLPSLDVPNEQIQQLNLDQLNAIAEAGRNAIINLQQNITFVLNGTLEEVSNQKDLAGVTIDENLNHVTDVIGNISQNIGDINATIENGYQVLNDYYPYFYYSGMAVACILLLVFTGLFFGLILGVFGSRPEMDGRNFCTKKTGSHFLMTAVSIIFIFTIVIGSITLIMLSLGVIADRVVCKNLQNLEKSALISFLNENILKSNQSGINVTISSVLTKCFRNESLYNVFGLKSVFDIDQLNEIFNDTETLKNITNAIKEKINSIIPSDFTILDETNLNTLNNLTTQIPDIQLASFESQLNFNAFIQNLTTIFESLQQFANTVQTNVNLHSELIKNMADIKNYQQNNLQPVKVAANKTLELAESLDAKTKMNHSSFSEAISTFVGDVKNAQESLKSNTTFILNATVDFGEIVIRQIFGYLHRVINVTKEDLGQCGPLNVAFNATLIGICDNIVLPWNGFSVSLYMCLIIFVPIIILAIWLASLYKKYIPNEQNFGRERDYYYGDQNKNNFMGYYQEGQNSVGFNKNDANNRNSFEYLNNPRYSRYNDMAPKFIGSQQQSTRF